MKKELGNTILIIFGILAVVAVVGFIMAFYGTPWGNASAHKEFVAYLSNKFSGEIVIDDVYFDFERGSYSANCSTKETPVTNFSLYHINGKIRNEYFLRKWENEINNHLNTKHPYHGILIEARISWSKENSYSTLFDMYGDYSDKTLPSYFTQQSELSQYTSFVVRLSHKFESINNDIHILYDSVNLIKENFIFNEVFVRYEDKIFTVSYEDAAKVTTIDEFQNYLEFMYTEKYDNETTHQSELIWRGVILYGRNL